MSSKAQKTDSSLQRIPLKDSEQTWQSILSNATITTKALLEALEIEKHPLADDIPSDFPLKVPMPYLQKIAKRDINDPLLLQVLPQARERNEAFGYSLEPLEEQRFTPVRGLIHKYRSRVLLISTQACAIHCRYCFRRNFPYEEHQRSRAEWEEALLYIKSKSEVNEVILSGGDPLTLSDRYLKEWLDRIDDIETVQRIRIHTRLLPSLPQRITSDLCETFASLSSKVILISHCNHPNELGDDTKDAYASLKNAGVTLLNQSVLLKNVNNNAATLTALSEALFEQGVLPYYLFLLDKVQGAAHFDITTMDAKQLHKDIAARLPGFLVPKLAFEQPGETSKTTL